MLDLLADLRKHLQEESEPPVYVSDRRLVKSLALLQVTCLLGASCRRCAGHLRLRRLASGPAASWIAPRTTWDLLGAGMTAWDARPTSSCLH